LWKRVLGVQLLKEHSVFGYAKRIAFNVYAYAEAKAYFPVLEISYLYSGYGLKQTWVFVKSFNQKKPKYTIFTFFASLQKE